MKKGKLIGVAGIVSSTAIAIVLLWSGYIFFRLEQKLLADKFGDITNAVATIIQNENLTLNNLAGSYKDRDGANKQAFAIGMTGNAGKMQITFDDGETERKETGALPDSVPSFNKDTLERLGISFIPGAVHTINDFEQLLKDSLRKEQFHGKFYITRQARYSPFFVAIADSISSPGLYTTRPFIINYYQPDVYRIGYTISAKDILINMAGYIAAAIFILLLVPAAFLLYYRAYRLQHESAMFKETLLSNITHELKTPLTSLQLIIESLVQDTPAGTNTQNAGFASSELNRMKLIVDKILAYGKMNSLEFSVNVEVIDISEVVTEAVHAMHILCMQNSARVEYEITEPIKFAGDRTLLVNMLTSLIDNGIKYNTNKAPRIFIKVSRKGNSICIIVSDNGVGIDTPYREKIFEPFFRVPTGDTHDVRGNGLGLSFVAQAVQLHNGRITVDSRPGGGAVFTIIFPC